MAGALSDGGAVPQRLVRIAALALAALLTGCGTTMTGSRDGTPARKLDPDRIADAVPRRDPVTKAGNKNPYTVLGKTYRILPSAKGYRARGRASWYGTKFHGRSTANGENYDVYAMTAAHCTLPIPAYVQVTNLENGRRAIVRVNDRGPFVDDRLIDLSYAAAVKLGYAHKGTALVEVVAIDVDNWPPRAVASDAPPPRLIAPPPAAPAAATLAAPVLPRQSTIVRSEDGSERHYVQAGAFQSRITAEGLQQQLAQLTRYPVVVQMSPPPVLYRVRIGPLANRAEAEQLRAQLLAGPDDLRNIGEPELPR